MKIILVVFLLLASSVLTAQDLAKPEDSIRIATYNVALNRKGKGKLTEELEKGDSQQAKAIAEVIQLVRPDILLVNELILTVVNLPSFSSKSICRWRRENRSQSNTNTILPPR